MILTPENIAVLNAADRARGFEPKSAEFYAVHERIACDPTDPSQAESTDHLRRWRENAETPGYVDDILDEMRQRAAERAERAAVPPKAEPRPRGARRPAKSNGARPRIFWRYAPVPIAILDDATLSANAKAVAAAVARSINLGPWNTDLHADISYAELAKMATVGSGKTASRAVAELREPGYIETTPLGRGGNRFRFGDRCR